jgi:hypothetical protein
MQMNKPPVNTERCCGVVGDYEQGPQFDHDQQVDDVDIPVAVRVTHA